ncbi:CBS domain-containing protein [Roseicyclus persicicus]|uniref:CBS domain-containing protein n=1 Tax=Roseicyclus persicicus TaxID=2650661 RepID=A0A7X6JVV3_9RHOB|nr:CBS domain-containing protein [Roseibacterium persicicum]NKX43752.1 CBS domain-containing protein [Roseibacterium persicicum]
MSTDLRVRTVMQADILRLSPDDPIRRAIGALISAGAAAAPVVDAGGAPVGILTQKDCFRPALHASYYQEWRGTVRDHMSATVVTVDAGDDIVRAAELFLEVPHRVLPVIEGGRLVGMLERSAVLAALFARG